MLEAIRTRLQDLAPDVVDALLPPASDAQLQALEAAAGQALPADLLALYRESAGHDPDATANFARALSFMSVEAVTAGIDSGDQGEPVAAQFADAGIRPVLTLGRERLVIGSDVAHCRLCVDLTPDVGGTHGQVIFIDEELEVALLLAPSVSAFLQQFDDDLAAGRYTLAEDALEDDVQWLDAARGIDVGNWYNSPTWAYVDHPHVRR